MNFRVVHAAPVLIAHSTNWYDTSSLIVVVTDENTRASIPSELETPLEADALVITRSSKTQRWDFSDGQLVVRARSGDVSAFSVLFERYHRTVESFVAHMVLNRDDAEDITQECFVRAFENLHRFREECRFTTWLLRIAMNLCADRARMRSRRCALEDKEAADGLRWMTAPGSECKDPVENLETERRVDAVRRALNALPEHHRLMLVLRDIEQKDYEEITQILGCTYGGAKLRVLRARRALRDRLRYLLESGE